PQDKFCPLLAPYAKQGGHLIGENILRHLAGEPLLPFCFAGSGEATILGHRRAVAQVGRSSIYGLSAWLGWRLILWMHYSPGGNRKIRLALDWLKTAIAGRNTDEPQDREQSE